MPGKADATVMRPQAEDDGNHKKLQEVKEVSSPRAPGRNEGAWQHLNFRLLASRI